MYSPANDQISKSKSEVAELKALHEKLQLEFDELSAEQGSIYSPKQVIDLHIKRLKEYNELRDAGLRLAQLVADEKSCKIKDVFEEMGYSMLDG